MQNFVSTLPELIALVLGFALLWLRVKQRRTQEELGSLSTAAIQQADAPDERQICQREAGRPHSISGRP